MVYNSVLTLPMGLVYGRTHSYNIQTLLVPLGTAYAPHDGYRNWFPVAVAQAGYGYFLRKCYKPN